MRARLLDATIECLFELGYAGTTTTVVCDRAGVSRGAQLHHFPTKALLVTTALERVVERLHGEFRQSMSSVPSGKARSSTAIDLLWKMVSSPTYYAWLELVVAARTDADLRARVNEISAQMGQATLETFRDVFPDFVRATPSFEVVPSFAFSVLEGLAVRQISEGRRCHRDEVVGVLKNLAQLLDQLEVEPAKRRE